MLLLLLCLALALATRGAALRGGVHQLAAHVAGPVAGLELVRVHQAAGAALEQCSAEDAHIVLGAVRGMRVVAELLGAVEAKAIGAGGFDVGAEAA